MLENRTYVISSLEEDDVKSCYVCDFTRELDSYLKWADDFRKFYLIDLSEARNDDSIKGEFIFKCSGGPKGTLVVNKDGSIVDIEFVKYADNDFNMPIMDILKSLLKHKIQYNV